MSKFNGTRWRALKPDAQAFDRIEIITVPRLKCSGLSGDQRWISIGCTHLQEGWMAVIRGISKPTTF